MTTHKPEELAEMSTEELLAVIADKDWEIDKARNKIVAQKKNTTSDEADDIDARVNAILEKREKQNTTVSIVDKYSIDEESKNKVEWMVSLWMSEDQIVRALNIETWTVNSEWFQPWVKGWNNTTSWVTLMSESDFLNKSSLEQRQYLTSVKGLDKQFLD